jgi:hypothetical protein
MPSRKLKASRAPSNRMPQFQVHARGLRPEDIIIGWRKLLSHVLRGALPTSPLGRVLINAAFAGRPLLGRTGHDRMAEMTWMTRSGYWPDRNPAAQQY